MVNYIDIKKVFKIHFHRKIYPSFIKNIILMMIQDKSLYKNLYRDLKELYDTKYFNTTNSRGCYSNFIYLDILRVIP